MNALSVGRCLDEPEAYFVFLDPCLSWRGRVSVFVGSLFSFLIRLPLLLWHCVGLLLGLAMLAAWPTRKHRGRWIEEWYDFLEITVYTFEIAFRD